MTFKKFLEIKPYDIVEFNNKDWRVDKIAMVLNNTTVSVVNISRIEKGHRLIYEKIPYVKLKFIKHQE